MPLQTTRLLVRKFLTGAQTVTGIASGRWAYFGPETEAWWTEDQGIWVTVPNESLAFQKLRHEPPTSVWIPSLGEDEGDKWGSSRECRFTSYSLKAHLHLFHPHTGLNWAFDGLNTSYPTCLYSSDHRPSCSQATKRDHWLFAWNRVWSETDSQHVLRPKLLTEPHTETVILYISMDAQYWNLYRFSFCCNFSTSVVSTRWVSLFHVILMLGVEADVQKVLLCWYLSFLNTTLFLKSLKEMKTNHFNFNENNTKNLQ